ncbi:MAG: GNAT family N-acetyltransferase [Devosia sp.]
MGLPGVDVIERAGLKAWPGIEVEYDGAWVRRAACGYTQRANSIQSLDVTDDCNAAARLAAGRAWMEARGVQAIFRQTPLAGPRIVEVLDVEGWRTNDASHLFAMKLGSIAADPHGEVFELLDPRFLAAQQALRGYADDKLERLKALLAVIEVPARGVVLYAPDAAAVATSLMAVADGIVITGNVITDTTQRRKGYAAAMMRTGLAWAREAGATIAALNVAADNLAGQGLYRGLGYTRQYDYCYRLPVAV